MGTRNGVSSGIRWRTPGSRYLSITSADGSTCVSASQTLNPFFVVPAPIWLDCANHIPPFETLVDPARPAGPSSHGHHKCAVRVRRHRAEIRRPASSRLSAVLADLGFGAL